MGLSVVFAKLYAIMDSVADSIEMDKKIFCAEKQLKQLTFNIDQHNYAFATPMFDLAATSPPDGIALLSLKISLTNLAATGMLLAMMSKILHS